MARGVNKVILIGNLGGDPEVRYLPSGGAVCNFTVATSESWTDKQTGQKQERTEWHKIVIFNRLAEIAGEYARKGSKVYLEGSLRTRKWQDKQSGEDRYTTEIVVDQMQLLDGRREDDGGYQQQGNQQQGNRQQGSQQQGNRQQGNRRAPPPNNQPQGAHNRSQGPSPMAPQGQPNPGPMGGFDNSFDDDIPF